MTADLLRAIDEILATGEDADDALRDVVRVLVERAGCTWAAILFADDGELILGPAAGEPAPEERRQIPVIFEGAHVAELVADGPADRALLEQVAERLSPFCLVGWDTDGIPWDAVS